MWYGNLAESHAQRNELHRKAFELDPRSPVAGYNVANNLLEAGREAEAMDVFSKIVEADPYYPGAYRLVAGINEYNGRLDEAILQHKKVYNLEENSDSAARIAKLYTDLGDFDNADVWLESASQLAADADRGNLAWLTVSSNVARGEREKAETMLKSMMQVSGSDAGVFYDASYAAFLLGDFPAATEYFESAQEHESDTKMSWKQSRRTDATIGAAFAYKQLGQDEKSLVALARVDAELDSMIKTSVRLDPATWYWKAEVAAIQGEQQMSLVHLQRAVDQGWRQHWRPFIDPALAGVLDNLNFQSMMAGLEARMNLMREQLAFEESFRVNRPG
jgi:tetratricopeptide (TPR) repeat protein